MLLSDITAVQSLRPLQVRRRHREQLMQLLRVMRKVDLLESRFASATGHWQHQRTATAELERQLSTLEAETGPSASGKSSEQDVRVEAIMFAGPLQICSSSLFLN